MSKPKRVSARDSAPLVVKREEFVASSMRGESYDRGGAPYLSDRDTWMNSHETDHYRMMRASITYIVWSFATPIAYWSPLGGWYKVGQTFSSFTSRHQNGGLRLLPIHPVEMTGDKGDWTVSCGCTEPRHFTVKRDAERVLYNHR